MGKGNAASARDGPYGTGEKGKGESKGKGEADVGQGVVDDDNMSLAEYAQQVFGKGDFGKKGNDVGKDSGGKGKGKGNDGKGKGKDDLYRYFLKLNGYYMNANGEIYAVCEDDGGKFDHRRDPEDAMDQAWTRFSNRHGI